MLAVTGADFDVALDDRAVRMNTAFVAPAGSRLRFGGRRRGARAYVAIGGRIFVPPVLGSRATHVLGHMGGVAGGAGSCRRSPSPWLFQTRDLICRVAR